MISSPGLVPGLFFFRRIGGGPQGPRKATSSNTANKSARTSELGNPDVALNYFAPATRFWNLGFLRKRIEGGVDLEPAGREVVRDLQEGLELVERLLRLADEDVDSLRVGLKVGPPTAFFATGMSATPRSSLPDRLFLSAEVRECQAED